MGGSIRPMTVPKPPPASQVYTWEPSNAAIAARYGLRPEDVLRFGPNTSPLPPPFVAEELGRAFEPPLNEYPDSSYEELTAAAANYTGVAPYEVIVGAGADEISTSLPRHSLPRVPPRSCQSPPTRCTEC